MNIVKVKYLLINGQVIALHLSKLNSLKIVKKYRPEADSEQSF